MRTVVNIPSHGGRLSAWHFTSDDESLTGAFGRPCVVMAHGFGATKDAGLEPFAERFAAAGADVVAFDYRGFGRSSGRVRQDVDHRRHREDYRAAIAYARGVRGVDPAKVVVWGTSYSGGHVISVAASDPRVAGVVSQGAAMDGLAAVLLIWNTEGPLQLLRLVTHGFYDLARQLLRRSPHTIPVVGPAGSVAAITSSGAEAGFESIAGPNTENKMCARGVLRIMANRPVTSAKKVHVPVFLVVATADNIAPSSAVEKVAARVQGPSKVMRFGVGHFGIYAAEVFEESVTAQVEFIRGLFAA